MEEKKAKRTFFGSSNARDKDMISRLPDPLISQILSYLQTKEAVRTSVLSTKWRNLWLFIPGLDLDSDEFSDYNAFANFTDRCLDFYREEKSCLHKLKLSICKDGNENDQSCVTRWIDFVARARKLRDLDVQCFVTRKSLLEVMPVSLFICETLVYLSLHQVLFGTSFEKPSSVSLPRLTTMCLELNVYPNERSLESLISSCPVLEYLSIVRRVNDNVKVLRVRSQNLTSLCIVLGIKYYLVVDREDEIHFDPREMGVLVDAPRLKYLSLEDEMSVYKTITNSGSLTKVDILGLFNLEDSAPEQVSSIFFSSFSNIMDLKLSLTTIRYFKRMVPLPQFRNLLCLEAELALLHFEILPRLLSSCPNLKSLILRISYGKDGRQMEVSPVPLCLLYALEFVEISCKVITDSTMKLVKYFADNSGILKKLVVRLGQRKSSVNAKRRILALPTRSTTCEIIVLFNSVIEH